MDVRRNSFRCLIIKPEALGGLQAASFQLVKRSRGGPPRTDFINYPGGPGDATAA